MKRYLKGSSRISEQYWYKDFIICFRKDGWYIIDDTNSALGPYLSWMEAEDACDEIEANLEQCKSYH